MKRKPRKPRQSKVPQLVPIADVTLDGVRCTLDTARAGVVLTVLPPGEAAFGLSGEAQVVLAAIDRYLLPGRVKSAALYTILRFAYADAESQGSRRA